MEVIRKKKPNMNNKGSFPGKKPDSEGPAKVLDEKWLLKELNRLGWDEKTAQGILKIKRKIFKDEYLSASVFGQIDGINMNKKVNGLEITIFVTNWNISANIISISEQKRDRAVDGIRKLLESNIPGLKISAKRKRINENYEIRLAGAFNKPDNQCEGGKNVCKIESPPHLPEFHTPTVLPRRRSIRGC